MTSKSYSEKNNFEKKGFRKDTPQEISIKKRYYSEDTLRKGRLRKRDFKKIGFEEFDKGVPKRDP